MDNEGYLWIGEMENKFSPPPLCIDSHCRDMFMELIYIVAVPGGITLLTVLIVGICMFCCGNKSRTSEAEDDEIELDKYYTIRRASQSLRDLSHKRDTVLLSSRSGSLSYSDSDRYRHSARGGRGNTSYSAPSTLQRERRRHRESERSASHDRSVSPSPYHQVPGSGGRSVTPPSYQYVPSEQISLSVGDRLLPPSNNSNGLHDQQALLSYSGS